MVRILLMATGVVCVALGILGIFLPLLPTTPFLLVAAGCFARSSDTLHKKLLESPVLGESIQQWQSTRSIPIKAKITAISMVVASFGFTISQLPNSYAQIAMGIFGSLLILFLARIPTKHDRGKPGCHSIGQ